jgi:transposase InsO family protein
MKYQFIRDHEHVMPVIDLCMLLHVSRSAYYRWRHIGLSRRDQHNEALLSAIYEVHHQSRQVYGSPRICDALRQRGFICNRKRIARLMRLNGIRAKTVRRFKVTTRSRATHTVIPDLVQRRFTASSPNRVWTTDITYIWTREGWTYLAVVLDLFSRMIVGWETSSRLTASLVTSALQRAISYRQPSEGLILHSDRGSQYTSDQLRSFAKEQYIQLSIGRTGSCYDNAVTESFFHTLKTEHVYFHRYQTRQDARTSIFDYIETFYNQNRLHSTIGNLSPAQYELQCAVT